MPVVIDAGASARSVTSSAEVDLLGVSVAGTPTFSASGVAIANASRWSLVVTTDQDVTVRVYKAAGNNAGLAILTDLTDTVTSSAPKVIEFEGEANQRIRVTAQAVSSTAAVNCDFRAVSP